MKVVYKEPGKPAEVRNVRNELGDLQELVGGYIETVLVADHIAVVNEEGLLNNLAYNFRTKEGHYLFGPVVFLEAEEDEFRGLRDYEAQMILAKLQDWDEGRVPV